MHLLLSYPASSITKQRQSEPPLGKVITGQQNIGCGKSAALNYKLWSPYFFIFISNKIIEEASFFLSKTYDIGVLHLVGELLA